MYRPARAMLERNVKLCVHILSNKYNLKLTYTFQNNLYKTKYVNIFKAAKDQVQPRACTLSMWAQGVTVLEKQNHGKPKNHHQNRQKSSSGHSRLSEPCPEQLRRKKTIFKQIMLKQLDICMKQSFFSLIEHTKQINFILYIKLEL